MTPRFNFSFTSLYTHVNGKGYGPKVPPPTLLLKQFSLFSFQLQFQFYEALGP